MRKERNLYIDIIKAVSIILVIVGHCIQYGSGIEFLQGQLFFENPIFIFIYSFHMPLFMLISGYLFACSLENKRWDEVLLIKFKQLIIPLACWSVFSLCMDVCKVLLGNTSTSITVIWIIKKLIYHFVYGPWFLWAIWWCSLVILIVKNLLNDNFLIYICCCFLTFILPDVLSLELYKFMWPFFLIAYMFNSYDWKNKLKTVYQNKIFVIVVSTLFLVLLFFYDYDKYIYTSGYTILGKNAIVQIYNDLFRFVIGMVGSITVLLIIYAFVKKLPGRVAHFFAYIGKNTMGIYIISNYIFAEILRSVASSLSGVNYFYICIETLCILFVSIMITAFLKKNKLTNCLLLGGR